MTTLATWAPSRTSPNSASQAPSLNPRSSSPAERRASRVLPTPPGPTRLTSRAVPSLDRTSPSWRRRPTKLVSSAVRFPTRRLGLAIVNESVNLTIRAVHLLPHSHEYARGPSDPRSRSDLHRLTSSSPGGDRVGCQRRPGRRITPHLCHPGHLPTVPRGAAGVRGRLAALVTRLRQPGEIRGSDYITGDRHMNTNRPAAVVKEKRQISTSKLIRWAGLAAVVGGIIFAGIQPIHPPDTLASVTNRAWAIITPLKTVMCLLFLLGITGLYARQVDRAGWLGLAGFLLLSLAWALQTAFIFAEAFILPPLATAAPRFVDGLLGLASGHSSGASLGVLPMAYSDV